jgi:hypothetical protein
MTTHEPAGQTGHSGFRIREFTPTRGGRKIDACCHAVAASNPAKVVAGVLLYLSCPDLRHSGGLGTDQPSFSRLKAVYTEENSGNGPHMSRSLQLRWRRSGSGSIGLGRGLSPATCCSST